MGFTDLFQRQPSPEDSPLFRSSALLPHPFPLTLKAFLLKYHKQHPQPTNIFSKLYGKSKDKLTNFKKLEVFLDMHLEEGQVRMRRLGRFQKAGLCDSFSVEDIQVHLQAHWMAMHTFSIKDYCKNDIDKMFERILYVAGDTLAAQSLPGPSWRLARLFPALAPPSSHTQYFLYRNRQHQGGFLLNKKENFVFNNGVASVNKIAQKFSQNKNKIRDFYTFQNE